MSGKWLELLRQIAPARDTGGASFAIQPAPGIGAVAAIQSVAPSFGVELVPIDLRDPGRSNAAHGIRARGQRRPDRDVRRAWHPSS